MVESVIESKQDFSNDGYIYLCRDLYSSCFVTVHFLFWMLVAFHSMMLSDSLIASFQFLDNEDCGSDSFNVGGAFGVILLDEFDNFKECV